MATVSSSLSAKGVSALLSLGAAEENIAYSITGTFSATWAIERATTTGALAWLPLISGSGTAAGNFRSLPNDRLRVRCLSYASGTISYSLVSAPDFSTELAGFGASYDDDTAAAAGGVRVGQQYRNGNFIMVRLS